jgi:heparin binding hemagglutinin HbhA
MTFASSIDKTRKDIEKAIADKSPLLALAGVSDLAAQRVRTARSDLAARAENFDPKALREQAQATIASLPARAQEFPGKAQETAEDVLTIIVSSALTAYGDLSDRGKTLVNRVRGQQSTQDLKRQASTTVAKAKATGTTAKKSAATTSTTAKKSASTTSATAKKSAARTKTAAKSATTSAKKTAKAASKSAEDTASKLGD